MENAHKIIKISQSLKYQYFIDYITLTTMQLNLEIDYWRLTDPYQNWQKSIPNVLKF